MTLRRVRYAVVPALLAALAAPSAAHAQAEAPITGGAAAPGVTGGVAAATDGTHSLAARASALLGRVARFRGELPAEHAGRTVSIERHDIVTGQWVPTATAVVAGDGSYVARWRTDHIGRFRIRAVVAPADAAQAASASPEIAVTVFKPARATWYGPGFFGRRTACGERLTRSLIGVAHKTLPCGTLVAVYYKGASITVPVVDRGPFDAGASWDLTSAAAQALGFTVTDTIGAVRLRTAPTAAPAA